MSDLDVSASSQLVGLMSPLVKALVLLPNVVEIEVREKEATIFLSLSVDPSDRGRIIGKQGKILHSLRLLFQSIATIHGRNAVVEIRESIRGDLSLK